MLMLTALAIFCRALWPEEPDPQAVLVARARADVTAFRRETVAALRKAQWDDWMADTSPLALRDTATALGQALAEMAPERDDLANYHVALAHVRALSEALGQPLSPSVEEESIHAYRLASLAIEVTADACEMQGKDEAARILRGALAGRGKPSLQGMQLAAEMAGEFVAEPKHAARWAAMCIGLVGGSAMERARALVAELSGAQAGSPAGS
jgi:hypothetical protein